ncbi:Sulfate permease [Cronobacter dublinensis 1210]|uniref:Sulfate permease n=1 Tax=Cronobacter dublinensis 1210 TaxID=1208656 RepID=A0ABM9QD91_9ENTR|nr:Sulfate permease [Cronobacter dublinensis 1210]
MSDTQNTAQAIPELSVAHVLRTPRLLMRESLAGILTALALIPEVISFSVIAGVDPKVSLVASIVLCFSMSILGGARLWSPPPQARWRWSSARWCISTASATFCPRWCWAG